MSSGPAHLLRRLNDSHFTSVITYSQSLPSILVSTIPVTYNYPSKDPSKRTPPNTKFLPSSAKNPSPVPFLQVFMKAWILKANSYHESSTLSLILEECKCAHHSRSAPIPFSSLAYQDRSQRLRDIFLNYAVRKGVKDLHTFTPTKRRVEENGGEAFGRAKKRK